MIPTHLLRLGYDNKLAHTFSKLMFQGKISAANDLLATGSKGGVLKAGDIVDLDDQGEKFVLDILRSKHPSTSPAPAQAFKFGSATPSPVHPVIFEQIAASMIPSAALNTKGAAGPSGLDAYCWRRLCSAF